METIQKALMKVKMLFKIILTIKVIIVKITFLSRIQLSKNINLNSHSKNILKVHLKKIKFLEKLH
jgi:hypothetical protein